MGCSMKPFIYFRLRLTVIIETSPSLLSIQGVYKQVGHQKKRFMRHLLFQRPGLFWSPLQFTLVEMLEPFHWLYTPGCAPQAQQNLLQIHHQVPRVFRQFQLTSLLMTFLMASNSSSGGGGSLLLR